MKSGKQKRRHQHLSSKRRSRRKPVGSGQPIPTPQRIRPAARDLRHAVTMLSNGSSYQYDANGNTLAPGASADVTCRVENSITYKQTYNTENRISNIMKMNGDCATGTITESWSFSYDGDGNRTGQVYTNIGTPSGRSTLTTLYFMGGAYETTVETSAVKKYYAVVGMTIATLAPGASAGVNDGNGMKYLLTDHLGSVIAITNDSGSVLSQQRYMPFGGVRTDVGNIAQTDFGYTGQRGLSMGLMDYKARFYDSVVGRFIQPDSIIPSLANPQTWNRYSYVYNNPINLTDPTGNFGQRRDDKSDYQNKITQKKVNELETQWRREKLDKTLKQEMQQAKMDTLFDASVGFTSDIPSGGKPLLEPPPPGKSCNVTELTIGAALISGAEALAIILGGVAAAAVFPETGPIGAATAFYEAFEFANSLFTPAFAAGVVAIIHSGCIDDLDVSRFPWIRSTQP